MEDDELGPENENAQHEAAEDPFEDLRASKPWLEAIADAEKDFEQYHKTCDNVDKQYANLEKLAGRENAEREMQIFWANLEVLKPSIYAREPVPVVQPRFKGGKQKELNRHASELLERSLIASYAIDDLHESMKSIRDDLSTNSRGVMWVRFEERDGDEPDKTMQRVCYESLDRRDFVHPPARKWKEVPWVARRSHLTREKMKKRFPEVDTTQAVFERRKEEGSNYQGEETTCVYELWHKEKQCVVWVTKGVEDVLDIRPPFLLLEGFFPCPRPAYGTVQRGTLKPIPDFAFYKDQVEEINEMTARISALAEALKLKGFYSAGNEDVGSAIEAAIKNTDNTAILIPVPNVGAFGGNGLKDAIVWVPVDQVAAVVVQLINLRKQLIDDVYQITGLSDIMRGSSDPNETLGAQQLKSQFGNVRIRDRQEEMVRIARDATRIAGEIMAENFSPENLLLMSQYDEVPTEAMIMQQVQAIDAQIKQAAMNPQMVQAAQANPQIAQQALAQANEQKAKLQQTVTFEAVIQFLRSQKMRPFSLDIETDSTVQPDEDAAKQRTTEFLTAMGTAMAQLSPMVQAQPETAEFAGEVLKFAVAPFRAGRALETAIDGFIEQMKGAASQPKEDPAAAAAKSEADMKAQELQGRLAELQQKGQIAQAQAAADLRKTSAEIEKIMAEIERINAQTHQAQTAPPKPSEQMQ